MFEAYAQKLGPPYSGLVQILATDTYRAITLDGATWEIQYVNRIHVRAATITAEEIKSGAYKSDMLVEDNADPRLIELMDYLVDVQLPFAKRDHYERWLLDRETDSPLAMLYSCTTADQMKKFPSHPEWTALPDSVMPVAKTDDEKKSGMAPVNYRVERMVDERAGINKKARWYDRREHDDAIFPPFLLDENWETTEQSDLYWRYINRQAPRLLMLQGLEDQRRDMLEKSCKPHASEVARFYGLYPKLIDEDYINALRVEARIRAASSSGKPLSVLERRDGVLYL